MSGIEVVMGALAAAAPSAGALAAISAGVGAVSAISQADAARRSAHTQADIARQRAEVERQQASVNEDAQRRRANLQLGQLRAGMAQSGTALDGTNADLYQQSAADAELDALNIRYGGDLAARSSLADANFRDMQASDASRAGLIGAATSALTAYGGYKRSTAKLG